jgi:hypothetical protein
MTNPDSWKFFVNMYYYSTEGQPRQRLDSFTASPHGEGGDNLDIARVKYDGNWNPEPLAWNQQIRFMKGKIDAKVHEVDLNDLAREKAPLIHIGGTEAMQWTDQQVDALRQYIDGGGVALIEDIGGGGRFQSSTLQLIGRIYPEQRVRPLASDSPIITGEGIGGFDVSQTQWRSYAVRLFGPLTNARLMAVYIDDQPRLIISGEDLSFGMLGAPAWSVIGYSPDSARKIMTNLALYARSPASPARKSRDETVPDPGGPRRSVNPPKTSESRHSPSQASVLQSR